MKSVHRARALLLSPVVVATGCASRPSTPAVAVENWTPAPASLNVATPPREDAIRRWQLPPGGPWAPYAKYTLISALDATSEPAALPDVMALDAVEQAAAAGVRLASEGFPPGTLFVVDTRGAASVAFGVALSRKSRQSVSLVPTFNNWPSPDELVPAEETLSALSTMVPRLPPDADGPTTPVFLLDSWRLAYRFDAPDEDTYDNRYLLSPSDLPDAETLRVHGIHRVVYVVEDLDQTTFEEDDLNATFLAWQQAGIPIAMVDLPRLEQPIPPDAWSEFFDDYLLAVVPRRTVVDDPAFYVRAWGGFGGAHAPPVAVWVGGTWRFGGRGGYHGAGG